jgi:ribosomal protein S17
VSVSSKYWHKKYRKYFSGRKNFQVHDEENFAVTGDKVVIRQCQKITPTKYYYVRNVIVPYPRDPPKEYDEVMK